MQSKTSEGNFTLIKCFLMCVENILVSATEDGSGRQRRLQTVGGFEVTHNTKARKIILTSNSGSISGHFLTVTVMIVYFK